MSALAPPASPPVAVPAHLTVAKPSAPDQASDQAQAADHPAPPAAVSIGGELASLDGAREALARGDAARALHLLDEYERRYPSGALSQEATMVRVKALLASGDERGAVTAGRRFVADHPTSPYAAPIRQVIGPKN